MQLQSFYGTDIVGSVYFYGGSKILGAPISDFRGMWLEKSPPMVSEEPAEADALGRLALDTLLSYRTLSDSGATPRGKSDWSTYIGSGSKSLSSFESKTIGVRLTAVASTLRLLAYPLKSKLEGLSVTIDTSLSVSFQDLGVLLRKVVSAVQSLQQSGDV